MKTKTLVVLASVALILSPIGRALGDTTIYTTGDDANSPDGVSARSAQQTTLTVQNTLNNATAFTWTGYHVDISMTHAFSIANPFVYNPGWTGAITQQPTSGNGYTGMIEYASGVPVPSGQLLSFSYQLTFTGGSTAYTQNLVPVPEPTSLSLVLGAGLLLAVTFVRRQKRVC